MNKLSLLLLAMTVLISNAQVKVQVLQCEYKSNPMGIDIDEPRLSWQMAAPSETKNLKQEAYHIQVAKHSPDFSDINKLIWNSGKVESNRSVNVVYKGGMLQSKTRYFWRVKIWDNQQNESHWSEPSYWEMGILNPGEWEARWISPEAERKNENKDGVWLLRKEMKIKDQVQKARLYITAHGLYEAYINGKKVGDQLFTPGWTSYKTRLQYQIYDVTKFLNEGKNATGVMLAEGWYRGRIGWQENRNYYGDQLSLLYQLEIEYKNGDREIICSNDTWASSQSPIILSSIYDGETYDARLEQPGWNNIKFNNKDWHGVSIIDEPYTKLIGCAGAPVRKIQVLQPDKMITTPKGETVIDFGQNMVGRVKFKIPGKKDDSITIYHAEVLDKEGNFYTKNLRSAKQKIKYIFSNDELITYEPHFTFQGFRYIKIEDYPGEIKKDYFKGIVIHSDMEKTGYFDCSDSLINQLQSNIQWGQKGNFLDVPTDCPQRDERMGWTGDAQVFASTACFNFDCAAFYTKWLRDVKADQKEDGQITFVVPDVLGGAGSTGWGDVGTILPWTMYLKYGDKRILKEQYESMEKWVAFLHNLAGNNLLVQDGFHFGDWLFFIHPTSWNTKPGYTDIDFIATAFFAYSSKILAKTALVLGRTDDHQKYMEQFSEIKKAFQKEFVTASGRLSPHSQTAYTLALYFDLLEEDQKAQAVEYLVQNIKSRNNHLSTGFLGTPYLCHVLTGNGKTEVAYDLLYQDTYPSWLYPIKRGATTVWERWDGIKPDSTFQTPGMNSFNHYAYGAIGDWMYSVITGIQEDVNNPGYKHIILKPHPDPGLQYAKASYDSQYGTIMSKWTLGDDSIKIDVKIPHNTTATLYLPGKEESPIELGSGNYTYEYMYKNENR